MRIISGKYKSQIINCPKGTNVRPTTDRVRESIFSSLYSFGLNLENINVLDAFAGSGALGFEALSRGAKFLVSFERDKFTFKNLLDNANKLKFPTDSYIFVNADIYKSNFCFFKSNGKFNLIFLDPPYKFLAEDVLKLLTNLSEQSLIQKDCIVVYEHSSDCASDSFLNLFKANMFEFINDKIYGDSTISYLKFKGA